MIKFISKLLGLSWLGDLAEFLNGKKTGLSLLGFVLSAVIILTPEYFPEYEQVSAAALKLADLLRKLGVEVRVVNDICTVGIGWGLAHKGVKKLEK